MTSREYDHDPRHFAFMRDSRLPHGTFAPVPRLRNALRLFAQILATAAILFGAAWVALYLAGGW